MEVKAMNNGAIIFVCDNELEKEVILNNWKELKRKFDQLIKEHSK